MSDDLETLEALSKAATAGPWRVSDKLAKQGSDNYLVVASEERWVSLVMDRCILSEEDAAFIAAAREAVPALIARVRELKVEVQSLYEDAAGESI